MQSHNEQGLPFGGEEPIARHASWTGAEKAAEGRKAQTARYIKALVSEGPLTDVQASARTGLPLSSVCSIRNGLGPCVRSQGQPERVSWGSGRTTLRTRWGWVGAE